MICANCGNTASETSKFCSKCGGKLEPAQVELNSEVGAQLQEQGATQGRQSQCNDSRPETSTQGDQPIQEQGRNHGSDVKKRRLVIATIVGISVIFGGLVLSVVGIAGNNTALNVTGEIISIVGFIVFIVTALMLALGWKRKLLSFVVIAGSAYLVSNVMVGIGSAAHSKGFETVGSLLWWAAFIAFIVAVPLLASDPRKWSSLPQSAQTQPLPSPYYPTQVQSAPGVQAADQHDSRSRTFHARPRRIESRHPR